MTFPHVIDSDSNHKLRRLNFKFEDCLFVHISKSKKPPELANRSDGQVIDRHIYNEEGVRDYLPLRTWSLNHFLSAAFTSN